MDQAKSDQARKLLDDKIARFETMVRPEADPNNDMAWYSLGGAYAEAGRFLEAAQAYERSYTLNPAMSKAYQLAGKALIDAQQPEQAAAVLTKGYTLAAERGDRMPMLAMGDLLKGLNRPVPEVATRTADAAAPTGSFMCKRTGRPGSQMTRPPFRGPVGEWIRENVTKETFDAWIAQGTKVINELRLDLSRDEDEKTYDRHMREYLGLDDETFEQITGRKPE
jgi:Fe-S cluster biosynthesis and repair protein YggX